MGPPEQGEVCRRGNSSTCWRWHRPRIIEESQQLKIVISAAFSQSQPANLFKSTQTLFMVFQPCLIFYNSKQYASPSRDI
jgi:hypothetical protein